MSEPLKIPPPFWLLSDMAGRPLMARLDDLDCAIAFTRWELAEQYIDQAQSTDLASVLEIPDPAMYRELLDGLMRNSIGHVCLNPTVETTDFRFVRVEDEIDSQDQST